jgi:hypothetical protein
VRREGSALKSNFITVLEPFAYGQQPRIEHVEVRKKLIFASAILIA